MGKTMRFDPSASADGDAASTPFNPAFADALACLKEGAKVEKMLDSINANVTGDPVVDVLADALVVETPSDTVAPSGDAPPAVDVPTPRPPKTHRGKAPNRTTNVEAVLAPKREARGRLAPDAKWNHVPFRQFYEFDTSVLGAIVTAIRNKGERPIVAFVVRGEYTMSCVHFGLAMVHGEGDEQRVQMSVCDGEGFFTELFAPGQKFFRDELFGYKEAPPHRLAQTRGLSGMLEIVLSQLA